MNKTLIAFGCSFTYGDELLDPNIKPGELCNSRYNDKYRNSHCYAGIVAKHYDLNFLNTAFPGGSLESMRYALHWVCENYNLSDTVLIAGLTQSHRNSYFDADLNDPPWNRFRHSTWLKDQTQDPWNQLNHSWIKMCSHSDWDYFNLQQTVGYFENCDAIMLPVYSDEPTFSSANKTDFVLQDILDDIDYAPGGHPNESGHSKIANRLINYIDSVTII